MTKRKHSPDIFLERSLKGALDFFKEAIFSDEIARLPGLLQAIDERVKIIALIMGLLAISFARSLGLLAALYAATIILAAASRVHIGYFLKRVWVFIPIFTLVIAIPAVFIQGWHASTVFVMRVATSVSWVVLMTVTTRHAKLLKALASIGIPAIFIQVLDMTYRYIFFFIRVFEDMHTSLKARLVRRMAIRDSHSWIGSRISYLFKRSMKMSEEVYMAMLARGYTGDFKGHGK
jgi:cobalt/nickel transport system permease protein